MSKYGDRFIIREKHGGSLKESGLMKVIVDRETGVNYLYVNSGYSGGLTVMLDATGNPIVTPILDEE